MSVVHCAFNRRISESFYKPFIEIVLLQPRAWPFVKWRGGKRNLAAEIIKHLPESCGRYYEPFVGGGALFFALRWKSRSSNTYPILNADLMDAWRVVKHRPKWLINRLYEHKNSTL